MVKDSAEIFNKLSMSGWKTKRTLIDKILKCISLEKKKCSKQDACVIIGGWWNENGTKFVALDKKLQYKIEDETLPFWKVCLLPA